MEALLLCEVALVGDGLLACGLGDSGCVCVSACEQYEACDKRTVQRVTHRFMSNDGAPLFAAMIRQCAATGVLHPAVAFESKCYNIIETCEQDLEGIHALIGDKAVSKQKNCRVDTTFAIIRFPQHMDDLENLRARAFCSVFPSICRQSRSHLRCTAPQCGKSLQAYKRQAVSAIISTC